MEEQNEPVQLDEFQSILVISLNRIYDAQMALLAHLDSGSANRLSELHAAGHTLAPDPAVYVDPE